MSYQEVLWQDILGRQVKSIIFVSEASEGSQYWGLNY